MSCVVTVHLFIKGDDYTEARKQAVRKLNEWYLEDDADSFIPDFGYPEGSLLAYAIKDGELSDAEGEVEHIEVKPQAQLF